MKFKIIIAALILFSTQMASANGYIGGALGLQVPSQSAFKNRFAWGFDGGYKFDEMFSIGANINFSSRVILEKTALHSELSASISNYHLHGRFFVWEGLYLGVGLGVTSTSMDVSVLGTKYTGSNTEFSFAPQVGYDYKLSEEFSLGGYLDYIFVPEGSSTDKGFTVTQSSYRVLNILATVKYWF